MAGEKPDRATRLLSFVDVDSNVGLEIGPLDKPLVKRSGGRRIFYCDYARREVLASKSSADPNVTVAEIPEIDFVASPLSTATFGGQRFDYVIASHVIEHVPDLIGWLNVLLEILSPGGRIVLAVPDRRYTFDYLRPLSTVGAILEAHVQQRSTPSFQQVYDGFSLAVKADVTKCWAAGAYAGPLERYYTREKALQLAHDTFRTGAHHDCHCWVFEHSSFMRIMDELRDIGLIRARVIADAAPVHGENEFHVVLGHLL